MFSSIKEQVAIVVLLVLVLSLGILSAYKYLLREAAVTPQEMELQALIEYVYKNPDDLKAKQGLAFAYQKTGDLIKAQQQYHEVLKKNSEEIGAVYNLGVIATKQKKYSEAEELYKKVLGMKETHLLAALGLGEVYIAQAKYDEAIGMLNNSIKKQGHLTDLRLLKAVALEKKGDKTAAASEYRNVLKYVPNHQEAKKALERIQAGGS